MIGNVADKIPIPVPVGKMSAPSVEPVGGRARDSCFPRLDDWEPKDHVNIRVLQMFSGIHSLLGLRTRM